jgi:hypothetical protein
MEGGTLRNRRFVAPSLVCAILLFLASSLVADNLVQQRWQRWQQQSVGHFRGVEDLAPAEIPNVMAKVFAPAVSDIKVNNDDGTATFTQRFSDIAYFPDGKGVAVWEDERNGEWEICAQLLTAEGLPSGANVRLIRSTSFLDQRQPRLAVNASGKLAIVWNEVESASIYAMVLNSSLTPLVNKFKLNDNSGTNAVNLPVVTVLSSGQFVAVWEDSRSGANIYGQIIDDAGNRIGVNFQVNSSVSSPYRIAPDVGASKDTTFAVVWEDARDGRGHSYIRILKNDGTPLYNDLMLESDFLLAYQFNPQVEFIKGKGYLAGWISNRDGNQSTYAQIISAASVPVDTSVRVNAHADDVCWDLRIAASPDSGVGCVFANISSTASIVFQRISKLAVLSGGNITLSDNVLLGERSFPALAYRPTGLNAVWTDQRIGNPDIFQQRLDLAFARISSNLLLNDDQAGSQQLSPDVAKLPLGSAALVWRDSKTDPGDVYLQRVTAAGALSGSAMRVNDDPGLSLQNNPRIGTSGAGDMVTVWEDSRTATGIAGQNIFAQRIAAAGTKVGPNFVVNDDGTLAPKSQPDIGVGVEGSFKIVWTDERSGRKQIFLQRYSSSGTAAGANQLVPDVPSATESFAPHIGVRDDGSSVVTYLSIIGGRQTLYFQRFNTSGQSVGNPQMIDVDTSQVEILDADIFVHGYKGSFYIATIQSSAATSVVKWYRYGSAGNLELGNIQVSDVTGASFADLRSDGDIDDAILVSWSDLRSGVRRGYFQVLREDGLHLGINTPMSTSATPSLQELPAAVLNRGFVFAVWADNRNAGRGFDVFLNFNQYTSTDVGDITTSLPKQFELEQNFPNPFNPETVIRYSLRANEAVKLTIYNTLGQQVRVLVDDYQVAGLHSLTWDGASSDGSPVASGIYFYRLQAGDYSETRKMTLLK